MYVFFGQWEESGVLGGNPRKRDKSFDSLVIISKYNSLILGVLLFWNSDPELVLALHSLYPDWLGSHCC